MQQIGFIGLGVMGEPMRRNLAKKTGMKVVSGWFEEAIDKGDGQKYHPVISRWMTTS